MGNQKRLPIGGEGKDKRQNHSSRAETQKLMITKGRCKHCGHHKRLQTATINKCSKCKR